MVRPPMVTMLEELEYWRALAYERERQIETLRTRLLAAIDAVPDAHLRAFVSSLDATRPSWVRELDFLTATAEIEPTEVTTMLDDLWRRVAVDHTS